MCKTISVIYSLPPHWVPNCSSDPNLVTDYAGRTHKDQDIHVSDNELDAFIEHPFRVCHTEGRKEVREQQTSHTSTCMENLEKWYRWAYLCGGNKDASLVAQLVKNLPAMPETRIQSLHWEDPLGREWLLTPVFLAGESHGQRSLEDYMGSERVRPDLVMTQHPPRLCESMEGYNIPALLTEKLHRVTEKLTDSGCTWEYF